MKKRMRQLHRWLGLMCSAFLLLFSLTALALNHQTLYLGWLAQPGKAPAGQPGPLVALAVDPFEASHIVASDARGLFESRDQGSRWQAMNLPVPTRDIALIAFSPRRQGTLVVGQSQGSIFVSEDRGQIWDELDLPFSPLEGEAIRQLGLAGDQIYLSTRRAVYQYHLIQRKWATHPLGHHEYKGPAHLNEWVYQLHTGRLFGAWGVYVYDLVAAAFIFLSVSGLILFRRIGV